MRIHIALSFVLLILASSQAIAAGRSSKADCAEGKLYVDSTKVQYIQKKADLMASLKQQINLASIQTSEIKERQAIFAKYSNDPSSLGADDPSDPRLRLVEIDQSLQGLDGTLQALTQKINVDLPDVMVIDSYGECVIFGGDQK